MTFFVNRDSSIHSTIICWAPISCLVASLLVTDIKQNNYRSSYTEKKQWALQEHVIGGLFKLKVRKGLLDKVIFTKTWIRRRTKLVMEKVVEILLGKVLSLGTGGEKLCFLLWSPSSDFFKEKNHLSLDFQTFIKRSCVGIFCLTLIERSFPLDPDQGIWVGLSSAFCQLWWRYCSQTISVLGADPA